MGRGRPRKYATEEERIQARRLQQRIRYYKNHETKREYNRNWNAAHADANRKRAGKWIKDNPEKHREHCRQSRKRTGNVRRYGLTLEGYYELLKKQNSLCAICGRPETRQKNGRVVDLSVDHSHESGEVRGLLCGSCNTALGLLHDDTSILVQAINYLLEAKGGRDGGTDDAEAASGD